AQALFSDRGTAYGSTSVSSAYKAVGAFDADEKQSGASVSVSQRLVGDWQASLTGNYSNLHQTWNQLSVYTGKVNQLVTQVVNGTSRLSEIGILADGSVFNVPGGAVKA